MGIIRAGDNELRFGEISDVGLVRDGYRLLKVTDGYIGGLGGITAEDGYFADVVRTGVGTTAIPSYSFQNDSDTGFLNPVADQLGIVTSGTEAIRIDDSQNIGIGTTAPTHKVTFPSGSSGIALYNTADQITNFERLVMEWSGSIFQMRAQSGGSGGARVIDIENSGGSGIRLNPGTLNLLGSISSEAVIAASSGGLTTAIEGSIGNGQIPGVRLGISGNFGLATAGTQRVVAINGSFGQGGTVGYNMLEINSTEITTGSGEKNFIIATVGGTTLFKLSTAGDVNLVEQSAPSLTAGFGKLYVSSSDNNIHFVDSSGTDTDLILASSDVSQAPGFSGADGYVAFFTGDNQIAGDNDLFYNRATGDLTLGGGGDLTVSGALLSPSTGGATTFKAGTGALAPSTGDIAIGDAANTTGSDGGAIAIGDGAVADGITATVAIGEGADAGGGGAVAIGGSAAATAGSSTAVGSSATAGGTFNSTALGALTSAAFDDVTAVGAGASASAAAGTAVGRLASAAATATALGAGANALATRSTALGNTTSAAALGDVAIGDGATTTGSNGGAISIGDGAVVNTDDAPIAIGEGAASTHLSSIAFGAAAVTTADNRLNLRPGMDLEVPGAIFNTPLTTALDAYGTGNVGQTSGFTGADGYVAFWTGPNAIAGDNDLFYDRATGDLTLGGGGNITATGGLNVGFTGAHVANRLTVRSAAVGASPFIAQNAAATQNLFEVVENAAGAIINIRDSAGTARVLLNGTGEVRCGDFDFRMNFLGAATSPQIDFATNAFLMYDRTDNAFEFNINSADSLSVQDGYVNVKNDLTVDDNLTVTNGSIGIGTSVVPHGGNGAARFAMNGPNQSVNGPHMQFTTDTDDFPVFQQLNYRHDNMFLLFDCSFDGNDFRSSDATNFTIAKSSNALQFNYNSLTAAGDAFTFDPGFAMDLNGLVGFGTTSPNEKITVIGAISLQESVVPSAVDGYGKIFVEPSDGYLHYVDQEGRNFNLVSGGTGGSGGVSQTTGFTGADGYVAFWTGVNAIAGDNDFFWDRANNNLEVRAMTVAGGSITDNNGNVSVGVLMTADVESGIFVTDNFAQDSAGAYISATVGAAALSSRNAISGNRTGLSESVTINGATAWVANFDNSETAGAIATGGIRYRKSNVDQLNTAEHFGFISHDYSQGTNSTLSYNAFYSFGQFATTGSVITTHYDFRAAPWGGTGGTITNRYGLYIDFDDTVTTNQWGVYQSQPGPQNYFEGSVGIGTNSIDAKLHVSGDGYFDGYLMPVTDNVHWLGTAEKRWNALFLGPASLHIRSDLATDGIVSRDWTIGMNSSGSFRILQGVDNFATLALSGDISIGQGANTAGSNGGGIAIGTNALVNNATAPIAIGEDATASGIASIVIGRGSSGGGASSVTIGNAATVSNSTGDVAIGGSANASGGDGGAIAIGTNSAASANTAPVAVGEGATASGIASTAIGRGSTAASTSDTALGSLANTTGSDGGAVAIGAGSVVDGIAAPVAIGESADAGGNSAVAIGRVANAAGLNAVSVGQATVAPSAADVAIGTSANTTGSDGGAVAIGNTAVASGTGAPVAVGETATATGFADVAIGESSNTTGSDGGSVAIGSRAAASGTGGVVAVGEDAAASVSGSVAVGRGAVASNVDAVATGRVATASGHSSVAYGRISNAAGARAVAVGFTATAASTGDVAIGDVATTTGSDGGAVAIGDAADAYGTTSPVAIGENSQSGGSAAISMGLNANADGDRSVAIGNAAIAVGLTAIAIGDDARTEAIGDIAIGDAADTSGSNGGAIAIGDGAAATGTNAPIAIGEAASAAQATIAIGVSSIAAFNTDVSIGNASNTTGSDGGSVAIGPGAAASGNGGNVALGEATNASGDQAIAIGRGAISTSAGDVVVGVNATTTGSNGGAIAIGITSDAYGVSAPIAIGENSQSGGTSAISLGISANADGANSVAIGNATIAVGVTATAIGFNARTASTGDIAIGDAADTSGGDGGAVAIGDGAVASGITDPIAIGTAASAPGNAGIAIGRSTSAGANDVVIGNIAVTGGDGGAVSIGNGTMADGNNAAVAIGEIADAGGSGAVAIGRSSNAGGTGGVSIGQLSEAPSTGDIAIGDAANTTGSDGGSIAIGDGAIADGIAAPVAIGEAADAGGVASVALGVVANASGANDVAIGSSAVTTGSDGGAVAIGNGSSAGGITASIAIGESTSSAGASSLSIGSNADAAGDRTVSIGNSTRAPTVGDIAIGDDADTTGSDGGAIAIGDGAVVTSTSDPIAIGTAASAAGPSSLAIGRSAATVQGNDIAIGASAAAGGDGGAIALGASSVSDGGSGTVAIGEVTDAAAAGSIALGSAAAVGITHSNSIALGAGATTTAVNRLNLRPGMDLEVPGAIFNTALTSALDGYATSSGNVNKTDGFTGADGYIAFWTGTDAIAGDNDLFYNRATSNLTIGGGNLIVDNKIGVGLSPTYNLDVTSSELFAARLVNSGSNTSLQTQFNNNGTNPVFGHAPTIQVRNANSDIGTLSDIRFTSGLTTQGVQIGARFTAANTADFFVVVQDPGGNSEAVTVKSTGLVGIGTNAPGTKLDVAGAVSAVDGYFADVVRVSNGTAGIPSYSFQSDTNSGFYSAGDNSIGVATNGSLRWTFGLSTLSSSGARIVTTDGTNTTPGHSFSGESSTGMYREGTGSLSFSVLGTETLNIQDGYVNVKNDLWVDDNLTVTNGNVAIGVDIANEKLTINGAISLQETVTPTALDGYGKLHVRADGDLHFIREDGTDINISAGADDAFAVDSEQTSAFNAAFTTVHRVDPSGGGFTITLPTASTGTGKTLLIKNTTSSTNTITVDTTGGELIDGVATVAIDEGFMSLTFISYGDGWGRV